MKKAIEGRFTKVFGHGVCVEIKHEGDKWPTNWFFPYSKEKKGRYFVYVPNLNVYIRNTSID